ncbi:uracil-DNA glycosylase family protein [Thalassolituus hydrocarboniclasticus]|uniref:Uracil-DNA glycosylase family protein n=1 Tax=Thalassolituus hydrocarboniclasticus TaxID=2742796 RepID=A0ABY6ACI2_9GAMM|nr:uracil-DNA glycosylase family protein [Thalassolituus hydrocarboniclasticus]UXD87669.1 uracil-DNA glycosylase family protein [Thalassolituus hydrocarboniclasticus]
MSELIPLLTEIEQCTRCIADLPLGPRPVVRAAATSRLLIIGQAPGTKVHASGIPWDDASGQRLRQWLGVSNDVFYDDSKVAIMPMGFCYPGKGKSGDLPPRPECAPHWHAQLLGAMPNIRLTLLIGQYAQNYYLQDDYRNLSERVAHWRDFPDDFFALPHPSPRNQLWLKKHPWFEQEAIPALQQRIHRLLESTP